MAAATAPVTFTLDLEDHRPSGAADGTERYPDVTRRVLDFLDARRARGTFFVVGEVAAAHPEVVRDVAARGHEVGLHSWRHVPLTELDPATLRDEVTRGKALLEELSGRTVEGFRAPTFSLVPASRWAVDVLVQVGFTYSSSVLAARSPLFGDPELPTAPFRWPEGLVEIPCPVARVGDFGIPYLGGVYLRALPHLASAAAERAFGRGQMLFIYCHPYDFDDREPYWVVPDVGRLGSRLLWYGRRRTFAKVDTLLRGRAGAPLGERVAALHDLPTVAPAPSA
ncbi:MAG TPA: polysaccharide deacetylase family protein [Acidimicrobiia bacterium]